jgi:hypothetical protein
MYANELSHGLKPIIPAATTDAGVMKEMDLGEAAADHGELLCVRPCTVHKLLFTVTSEAVVGTTTPPTVIFTKRLTPFSATGEEVIGTLTIPDGTAVGATIELNVQVDLEVGDTVELSHTQGVGGTPAGQGTYDLNLSYKPEDSRENSEVSTTA